MSRLVVFVLMFPLVLLCLGASHECDDTFTLEVKMPTLEEPLPALEEAKQQFREMEAETAVAEQNVMGAGPGAEQQVGQALAPSLGSSPHNPIRITAQELVDEYWANKVRFKRDYPGRWYLIEGKVKMITDDSVIYEAFWPSQPISSLLKPLTPQSAKDDVLRATEGEGFTTTCYLRASSFQSDFYQMVECAMGWNQ